MSLICGILSQNDPTLASPEALEAMLDVTRHRARNGQRTLIDAESGIALGYCHTATFGQREDVPSWYEDDGFVAAVDGDIYDADSHLNNGLLTGRRSESAAVVAAFLSGEPAFPAGLDGVFSLFLWDRKRRNLYLRTDPLGHKLLYYYEDSEKHLVVFSTELKAVLAHPSVPRRLEDRFLPLYLSAGITPPPFTLVGGVRKLRPAECLRFSSTETKANRYWRPALETGPDDLDYWAQRTRSELTQAVNRTIGDSKKVAVYLSGGLDSSAVLAALKQSEVPEIQAFTLAFKGDSDTYDVDGAIHIASVTKTKHVIITVDPEADVTPELMSILLGQIDDPFESASRAVNELFLSKAAAETGIDSALTGGMPNFSLRRVRRLRAADPSFASGSLSQSLGASFQTPVDMTEERMNQALVQPVDMTVIQEAALANQEIVEGLDQPRTIQLDRQLRSASGRDSAFYQFIPPLFGFEERTPYLDTKMVELALSVPSRFKGLESAEFERAPLREAFGDILETDFGQREKRGFPRAPLPSWLRQILLPSLKPLADDGIVTPKYLTWLEKNVALGRKRAQKEAWHWFIFNCWYQVNIKRNDPLGDVR